MPRSILQSLLLTLLAGLFAMAEVQAQQPLTIQFLDVGQGDAALIQTPTGKTVLVDAGPNDANVATMLRQQGVYTIHLTVATHPHADHIGGMDEVLAQLSVQNYLDNGVAHTTRTYQNVEEALSPSGARRLRAQPRRLHLGKLTLEILPQPHQADNLNNQSVILLGSFGEFDFLLPGDAEQKQIQHVLKQRSLSPIEVLKASHHGARNGLTPAWLQILSPQVVVISAGQDNPYGHPSAWALRYYRTVADRVLRTDQQGTIRIQGFPQGTYNIQIERPAKPGSNRGAPEVERSTLPGLVIHVQADAPGRDHQNLNGEYVELRQTDNHIIRLGGYQICDRANHCFKLPTETTVQQREAVRIYTGSGETTGTQIFMGRNRAIWNNSGDQVRLLNPRGEVVATYSY